MLGWGGHGLVRLRACYGRVAAGQSITRLAKETAESVAGSVTIS
jgi:hypothetical protein